MTTKQGAHDTRRSAARERGQDVDRRRRRQRRVAVTPGRAVDQETAGLEHRRRAVAVPAVSAAPARPASPPRSSPRARRRPRGPRRSSGRAAPRSAPDRRHRPGRLQERRVVDAVPGPLAPHRLAPAARPARRRCAPAAQRAAQVGLLLANRQLRTWPSAVSRVRSQAPQNGWVTLAITPTRAGSPSTPACPSTSQVSAGRATALRRVGPQVERRPQRGQDLVAGHHLLAPPGVLRRPAASAR